MSDDLFLTREGLTAQTDQVMAEASEILPAHVAEMRQAIADGGKTAAFELRVLNATQDASPVQVAIMYTQALVVLAEQEDGQ